MRQRILSTLILILLASLAPAARAHLADPDEMDRACRHWLDYIVEQTGSWAGSSYPTIRAVDELHEGRLHLARVYHIDPEGFVVVPVLKELSPVKTYSEFYDFDLDRADGLPRLVRDDLRHRLTRYLDTYGSLDGHPSPTREPGPGGASRPWDRLAAGLPQAPLTQAGPLLTTAWGLFDPYNLLCPMGDGGRCQVGCVAVAMSQVMNYYEWPTTGVGSHTYYWDGDQSCEYNTDGEWLQAYFFDPYDWANMPDDCAGGCTPIQESALKELCFEVGVSLDMDYGRCGSATSILRAVEALPFYFRYEPDIVYESHANRTEEEWFEIIKSEINVHRPMMYVLETHAVVCDGWQEADSLRMFHMNWGCGGIMNAWYALDSLPGSTEPSWERLIRRIIPGNRNVVVRADGSGDYPTIQAAIDSVPAGFIIELEDGTFTGPGNRDLDFGGKNLIVRSLAGDPENCIIDCEGQGRGLLLHSGENETSWIRGITITGGYAPASSFSGRGGAVYCRGVQPFIEHCRMIANHADGNGGALCMDSSSVTLADCVMSGNTSGGLGGGMYVTGPPVPSIDSCRVDGNSAELAGGGMACETAELLRIRRSAFAGNSTNSGGGGIYCGSRVHLQDCAVHGNRSSGCGGGILYESESGFQPSIKSCTIAGNFAETTGGGLQFEGDAYPMIEETVLWGNGSTVSGDELYLVGDPDVLFGDCDVDSTGIAGSGSIDWGWWNIHVPPGFCDPEDCLSAPTAAGDYRLKSTAPCAPAHAPMGVLVGALEVGCAPDIYAVRADGAGEYPTIQAAVDAAGFYDLVELAGGTYTGEGNRDVDLHGKPLTVSSTCGSPDSCVMDCEGLGRSFHFHSGEFRSAILENLTMTGGRASFGGAIFCEHSSPTIRGCVFPANAADTAGGAISCAEGSEPLIEKCTLVANSAPSGGAVHSGASFPAFDRSILALSTEGEAVGCDDGGQVTLACCDLYGNAGGDWVDCVADSGAVGGNFSADPLFYDFQAGDYHLHATSPCLDAPGCGLVGALGRGFSGNRAWLVPAEVPTIQAGMDSAWAGDTVLVAPGAYAEYDILITPGTVLRSETGNATDVVIDAAGQGRILTCTNADTTTHVQGITFTGGLANGISWPGNAGGAVYCENATVSITGCVFDANAAAYGGALAGKDASLTLDHCTLSANAASESGGGIYAYHYSAMTVDNCIIAHSTGGGAASSYYGSTFDLACCDLYGNAGGDWTGSIADLEGVNGNFSADPLFCSPEGGNYHLHEDSPCAPSQAPSGCDLVGALGVDCAATAVAESNHGIPPTLTLYPAVPNPFNPVAEITYGIPQSDAPRRVVINVYDARGRRVITLVDATRLPGVYRVSWNGTDHKGNPAASGVYFYRIAWNQKTQTQRMVLLK